MDGTDTSLTPSFATFRDKFVDQLADGLADEGIFARSGEARGDTGASHIGLGRVPSYDLPADRTVVSCGQIASRLKQQGGVFHVAGCAGSAGALVARAIAKSQQGQGWVLCVCATNEDAEAFAQDLRFVWNGGQDSENEKASVLLFPGRQTHPYAEISSDQRAVHTRSSTLLALSREKGPTFVVVSAASLMRKVIPKDIFLQHCEHLTLEQELDREALERRLEQAGYLRVPLVEDPGTLAVRGAIVDIWPPGQRWPVRIELLGDLILSLRTFDPDTQLTKSERKELWLPPAREIIRTEQTIARAQRVFRDRCDSVNWPSSQTKVLIEELATTRSYLGADAMEPGYYDLTPLWHYFPQGFSTVVQDPAAVVNVFYEAMDSARAGLQAKHGKPHFELASYYVSDLDLRMFLHDQPMVLLHSTAVSGVSEDDAGTGVLDTLATAPVDTPTVGTWDMSELEMAIKAARAAGGKARDLEPVVRRIERWSELGLRVVIAARADSQAERLVGLLRHRNLDCKAVLGDYCVDDWLGKPGSTMVVRGPLSRGVVAVTEGIVLLTEEEIFGHRAKRRASRDRASAEQNIKRIEDLRSLVPGDLVIHVMHGVGRYLGLTHQQIGAITVDLLAVEYAGGDKLYVPVYRLNEIHKHTAGTQGQKLDRLGGQSFSQTKAKVRQNVRKMADELLQLYAERSALTVQPLPGADDDYRAFEATFAFEETPDQAAAIADVMRDLQSNHPMDRLVCGDVGFGKTEVAIRAAFQAASGGRQVAVLCPTTVLAQQHVMSFRQRLEPYGIDVRGLSRFQSRGEQQQVLKLLRTGAVDVVVGTHRLLSKDVHFKALGLLVVDEEQRFGVTHKERIKRLKQSVDVLTLSATPIPRTLQMAVSGLRDISLIGTAPVDRRAIRTIVTRYDEAVIQQAIEREMSRGGQVFYVYNRVEGLYERATRLQSSVPHARIAVAHGKMAESALEKTMLDFVDGKYDVLASTSIIESGIDIPRANTIIIDRADMFGLAQLYQLRGRVGRSRQRAYCYLVVPPLGAITDEARARVQAIEQHTELGSGFHIASLDLELRGSGDLLGAEQSGNVASVGFELFRQMLEDAVHELKGEVVVHEIEPELSFDVEALLPEEYIADIGVRLSLYKRLASALDEQEVQEISRQMQDRFGAPPLAALRLVRLMGLKTELRRLRVVGCEATAKSVSLHLAEDHRLDAKGLVKLVQKEQGKYRVTPDMRLERRATSKDRWNDGMDAADCLLQELVRYGIIRD